MCKLKVSVSSEGVENVHFSKTETVFRYYVRFKVDFGVIIFKIKNNWLMNDKEKWLMNVKL